MSVWTQSNTYMKFQQGVWHNYKVRLDFNACILENISEISFCEFILQPPAYFWEREITTPMATLIEVQRRDPAFKCYSGICWTDVFFHNIHLFRPWPSIKQSYADAQPIREDVKTYMKNQNLDENKKGNNTHNVSNPLQGEK